MSHSTTLIHRKENSGLSTAFSQPAFKVQLTSLRVNKIKVKIAETFHIKLLKNVYRMVQLKIHPFQLAYVLILTVFIKWMTDERKEAHG